MPTEIAFHAPERIEAVTMTDQRGKFRAVLLVLDNEAVRMDMAKARALRDQLTKVCDGSK